MKNSVLNLNNLSIIVKNISKNYNGQLALDNISFEANEGQILGLLGPNGAGKTTTMKILSCFIPSSSGEAHVYGLSTQSKEFEIKKILGYLPEHNPLYGNMYIREYLSFVSDIHKISDKKNRIDELIELTGLSYESNKKIQDLSKGYRQRVGIAQAIIHDPKVLILDEPISGLDPNQIIEIRELIQRLKYNKTIIFSSHILQEVESICDSVVILDGGKIVANEKMSNLSNSLLNHQKTVIEFTKSVSPELLMSSINNIQLEKISDTKYSISSSSSEDIRERLFDFAVQNNNKILELKSQHTSLENVFKTLTKISGND